jgi:DNA-binding winged helix-turn-helix (wHTH) protein
VHISWLRGKLSDAGIRHELIRTVYGAGYRFVVPPELEDRRSDPAGAITNES